MPMSPELSRAITNSSNRQLVSKITYARNFGGARGTYIYLLNYNKNLVFAYVKVDKSELIEDGKFEIEVEKTRYKLSIERHPLFDSQNKYLKS